MRLLVLGASGGIGRWALRLAAQGGHQVTGLARERSAVDAPAGVVVRRGDVTDPDTLGAAVAGHDAVISCLGLRRAGKSPWAALRSPPDLTEQVTRRLLPAMRRHGARRLAVVSAGGVADSLARLTWPVRRLVATANVGVAYRDLAAMERLLDAVTDVDWIVARPVTLVDGDPTGGVREVARYGLTSKIRRADVAAWLVAAATQPAAVARRKVLLGS